jgi:putative IMPACT (imprinted ancient) family translation regulator
MIIEASVEMVDLKNNLRAANAKIQELEDQVSSLTNRSIPMTTHQQSEIELILAVLQRKQQTLRACTSKTELAILVDHGSSFNATLELHNAVEVTQEISSLLVTLTILNNDRS